MSSDAPTEPHIPDGATLTHATTSELRRARVYIGNVNPGKVSSGFADSLTSLAIAELVNEWGCYQGKFAQHSGANISRARNIVIGDFLASDGEWLLWLDSDSVYPPDTIVRLLTAASLPSTPAKIIGGLCVMVDDEGVAPTLYHRAGGNDITRLQLDFPDDTILQVGATGAACLMVHREVLLAFWAEEEANRQWLAEHAGDELLQEAAARELLRDPSPENGFFQERIRKGRWLSEDVEFCLRLGGLGYRIYVDCTLQIGHQKHGRIWTARDIRTSTTLNKRAIGVVIPTRQRHDLAEALVDELLEQGEATEIVILDNGMAEAGDLGEHARQRLEALERVTVLDAQGLGVNAMWNRGVEHLLERHGRGTHIAILNDDLEIGPGFLGAMSRALESDTKLVAVSANYDGRRRPGLVEETREICAGRYDQTGGFAGFAFMIGGAWFGGGYRFPEQCMYWFGDNDLLFAALSSGAKVGIALGAACEHLDGGGQSAGDVGWSAYAAQTELDRIAFEKRWRLVGEARLRADITRRAHRPTEGAPICVMTAIFGDYDEPWPLLEQDVECDAILLSDRPRDVPGWRTIVLEPPADNPTPRMWAKRPRCRPDRYTEAKHVVWLDGHLSVLSPSLIGELVAQLGDGVIGAFRHDWNSSITDEAAAAAKLDKYTGFDVQAQAEHYLAEGHPDDYGLWTTGVMVRNAWRTIAFGDRWQAEVDRWGPEDQISLPFALRTAGLEMTDLPFEGWWVGRRFMLHPHQADGTM